MGAPPYLHHPMPYETHPHRTTGIALIVIGAVLLAAGVALASYCSARFYVVCTNYPFAGAGAGIGVLGVALLILGIVLAVVEAEGSGPPATPLVYAPAWGGPMHPLPPVPYAAAVAPPPAAPPASAAPVGERYCPVCGSPNLRVSAFCARCGRPLPPPT